MSSIQYTIRAVPPQLDAFLRRQAKRQDKSINKLVIEYMQQATNLDLQAAEDDFSWIIGANTMDDGSLDAIADFKKMDKQKSRV